jgi:hypothetical protein
MDTEMALPEVEEVQVVDIRLATLDLEDDPCRSYSLELVGTRAVIGIFLEQAFGFVAKAEQLCVFENPPRGSGVRY